MRQTDWQSDRRTGGIAMAYTCYSIYAVARKNVSNKYPAELIQCPQTVWYFIMNCHAWLLCLWVSGRGVNYCDDYVCVSVCLLTYLENCMAEPVAMARSFSGDVIIRYVLPVLWMSSCFHVTGPMTHHLFLSGESFIKYCVDSNQSLFNNRGQQVLIVGTHQG